MKLAPLTLCIFLLTNFAWAQDLSPGAIVYPILAPKLSSKFGFRFHPIRKFTTNHTGVDLAAPTGAHVRSMLPGKVIFAGEHASYGKLITIQHSDKYSSMYAHLSEIQVKLGQSLKAGDLIGRVGESGLTTGPHLHLEWRENGQALDPLKIFPALSFPAEG